MPIKRRSSIVRVSAAAALLTSVALGGALQARPATVQAAHSAASDPNTLTIGWANETTTLDPVNNPQNRDIWVMVNVYDQLVRVGPDGNTLLPDLATSWDISKDGKTYTFHLRPNVVFQNGAKLTASDVAFALNRARGKTEAWSWTLGAIKNVTAPNASTVKVTLVHPWAPFLSDVSLFDTGIYPTAYFKKVGASYMSEHPIGTGPYTFQVWKHGRYLRLTKNMKYWDAAKYPMKNVEYDIIPNSNTRLLQVESGQLDVSWQLDYNQVAALGRSTTAKAHQDPSTLTYYFTFNTAMKPFNEVKVRQAISHAIDRSALAKAITYGIGKPANSFIPKGAIDYDASIPTPTVDMALAKKLLAQSSVPHGFNMNMQVASGNAVSNEEAVLFQAEVKPLGINVTIVPVDPTTLQTDEQQGKYSFAVTGWTNDIPDPDELVSYAVDYTAGGHAFYTNYNNPTLIKLNQQAEASNDSATRQRLYNQIQQIWANDVPFLALFYTPYVYAASTKVQNFKENPLGYFNLQGVTKSS